MDTLPARLRLARTLGGLSARRLALLSGRTPQWVTALERGKYGAPGAASLAAVAETLGISVEWLLFGKGDAPTEESVRVAVEAASSKEAA